MVSYKKTKFANVAQMGPHGKSNKQKPRKAPPMRVTNNSRQPQGAGNSCECSWDHRTRNASRCGVDMRDAGQASPFDTVRGDDGKIDPKLAINHSTEAALSKCKAMETQIKQEIGFQPPRQPQAEGGMKVNRWNHPVPPTMS